MKGQLSAARCTHQEAGTPDMKLVPCNGEANVLSAVFQQSGHCALVDENHTAT